MRSIVAIAVLVILAGLLLWQQHRERAIAACLDSGGIWNGPSSTCEPPSLRPILQRDLHRS